jgi:hypothetical protein
MTWMLRRLGSDEAEWMRRIAAGWYTAAAVLLGLLASTVASAEFVDWEVDESLSQITLAVPNQDVDFDGLVVNIRMRNQVGGDAGPWNVGNTAFLDGLIATDYVDGGSIEFLLGQHLLFALPSGSYRPNPAAFDPLMSNVENPFGTFTNTSTAPGAYGGRVRASILIVEPNAAFVNFTDVFFDLASGALPITSGSFASEAVDLGIGSATVAFDGLDVGFGFGQPIPDAPDYVILDAVGANLAAGATVTAPDPLQPDLRMLTIPVDVDLEIDLGLPLAATATGTLVAFAVLPEPGATWMLASGGLLLAFLGRWRLRA